MNAIRSERNLKPADAVFWAVVLALSLVFFILVLHNLGSLSLWMDEGFHAIASQTIRAHGYPLFPSGHVYYKAILYTYVLALVSAVFGQNEFTLRIISLLAVAGSLLILFHLVKKLFSRWAALAAVLIMMVSPWVVENARLALYFAPLQLFYLLSLYFFYKGFLEDHGPSRWLAVLFFILTPQVHQLGMGIWFCFPALLFLRGWKRFFKKAVFLPFLIVTVFYGLMQVSEFFFWKVGYVYVKTDTSLRGMFNYFFSGFSLDYFKEFFKSFPWMSLAVLAGLFLCLGARRAAGGGDNDEKGLLFRERWLFFNMNLFLPLLFLGFFRTHIQPRYLFQLYSVFVILFCVSLLVLGRIVVEEFLWPLLPALRGRKVSQALGLLFFALFIFVFSDNIGFSRAKAIVERRYGDSIATEIITRSGRFEHYDHRDVGLFVRHFLKQDDVVIATHVVFGYVYAGRVDYWLWSGGPGTWDAWEKTPSGWRDFYVGARWLNDLAGLRDVIEDNSDRRVWLIASPSLYRRDHINREIAEFILADPGRLVFRGKDGMSSVFLWNEKPAVLTASPHTLEGEWLPAMSAEVAYGAEFSKQAALVFQPGKGREVFSYRINSELKAGRYRMEFRLAPGGAGASRAAGREATKALGLTIVDQVGGARLRTLFLRPEQTQVSTEFVLPGASKLRLDFAYSGEAALALDWIDIKPAEGRIRP
jgi:4-amino-4-deoxy-L-arabinose transferase-like glycosyltransferase